MQLDLVARRHLDFIQVDAFSSVPFAGNPAAVLFTHRGGDEGWMQVVAVENNLSETAFLERSGAEGKGEIWDIRWFTPGGEVALCGHATLASAHALWDTGRSQRSDPIVFQTRQAGKLQCKLISDHSGAWIQMDFPALGPAPADAEAPRQALLAAF